MIVPGPSFLLSTASLTETVKSGHELPRDFRARSEHRLADGDGKIGSPIHELPLDRSYEVSTDESLCTGRVERTYPFPGRSI